MREPCRFYSLLLPVKQHEALQAVSRNNQVPLAVCERKAIELFLKNKNYKGAKNGNGN
ncbi:MAG TPA: hypothetical protein ACFYD7_12665 [Candidatus Wujingus californicus]|uniref:hypothetical protein n=1 Tax=Candidatus Wujingus californicus TaxID=3367618 RepID=UPI0040281173